MPDGGMPLMNASESVRWSSEGSEASSPAVYGIPGRANTSSTAPTSTALPAYITMTRSATPATTPRSWLIRIIAAPVRSRTSASISRI